MAYILVVALGAWLGHNNPLERKKVGILALEVEVVAYSKLEHRLVGRQAS